MKVFGITDGSAGMVSQVRALAEALTLEPEMIAIGLPKYLRFLPNKAFELLPFLFRFISCKSLKPEAQSLIISCGRKAALVSMALKQQNPQIKTIHIQDPQMASKYFDLVIAMEHDKITGENVIKTRFALHNITPEKLAAATEKFASSFASYPKPHIAVLLGGSTNKYTLTKARMREVIRLLKNKLASGGSLLITPSRRTGAGNIFLLKQELAGDRSVYIYDGISENPYHGLLAIADEIIVSNDSVNMMSEAQATGKKFSILPLPDHKNTKPANFAKMLESNPEFSGDEMQILAEKVKYLVNLPCANPH